MSRLVLIRLIHLIRIRFLSDRTTLPIWNKYIIITRIFTCIVYRSIGRSPSLTEAPIMKYSTGVLCKNNNRQRHKDFDIAARTRTHVVADNRGNTWGVTSPLHHPSSSIPLVTRTLIKIPNDTAWTWQPHTYVA